MLKYLSVTVPGAIVFIASLLTPFLIISRWRRSTKQEPESFERLRKRAMTSLVLWLLPSLAIWTLFALTFWFASWEQRQSRERATAATSPQDWTSMAVGYLTYIALAATYCGCCYLLVRWNSKRVAKAKI